MFCLLIIAMLDWPRRTLNKSYKTMSNLGKGLKNTHDETTPRRRTMFVSKPGGDSMTADCRIAALWGRVRGKTFKRVAITKWVIAWIRKTIRSAGAHGFPILGYLAIAHGIGHRIVTAKRTRTMQRHW